MNGLFSYSFMANALAAVIVITPMLGILGTMIVHKQMAYFSDALGHSALTGIAIGTLLGISNASLSMVIFAVIFALLLNRIKSKGIASADTVISVFASASLALGLAILSKGGNFAKYSSLLVGDILSIRRDEILMLLGIAIIIIIFWCAGINSLVAISLHPTLARSRGMKVMLMENIFAILIAVLVMLSIRWIGILLINALLILPAAAARNLAVNMRQYHLYTVLIALFCGITGLLVSYYTDTATGPVIVLYAAIIYIVTYIRSTRRPKTLKTSKESK